jgi:hypothetical protein
LSILVRLFNRQLIVRHKIVLCQHTMGPLYVAKKGSSCCGKQRGCEYDSDSLYLSVPNRQIRPVPPNRPKKSRQQALQTIAETILTPRHPGKSSQPDSLDEAETTVAVETGIACREPTSTECRIDARQSNHEAIAQRIGARPTRCRPARWRVAQLRNSLPRGSQSGTRGRDWSDTSTRWETPTRSNLPTSIPQGRSAREKILREPHGDLLPTRLTKDPVCLKPRCNSRPTSLVTIVSAHSVQNPGGCPTSLSSDSSHKAWPNFYLSVICEASECCLQSCGLAEFAARFVGRHGVFGC